MLLLSVGAATRIPQREERQAVALVLAVGSALVVAVLWVVALWRAQQIEGRLAAQAEREKAIDMARRLATAQIEPHFLFNTLAGLQHWVQTKDERAAPLLAALTGYLRATLPLFDRPLLAAGDELLAIERYLQVLQARLGPARLQWRIDVDAAARAAQLPPGLLLTLVENAVQHGIEPLLSGGELTLRGRVGGDGLIFEVRDNGPGPAADLREGVGLTNLRQRLALTGGPAARLSLEAAAGGGCRAEIRIPLNPGPPAERP
jgi:LytS/YehU family sensor histidine kinase